MLRHLTSPLTGLLLLVVLYTVNSLTSGYYGETTSGGADVMYSVGVSLFIMWWVYLDRRQRQHSGPFEFEAFIFFAWIIILPVYLFQTRRWKALPMTVALYVAIFFPYLAGVGLYGW